MLHKFEQFPNFEVLKRFEPFYFSADYTESLKKKLIDNPSSLIGRFHVNQFMKWTKSNRLIMYLSGTKLSCTAAREPNPKKLLLPFQIEHIKSKTKTRRTRTGSMHYHPDSCRLWTDKYCGRTRRINRSWNSATTHSSTLTVPCLSLGGRGFPLVFSFFPWVFFFLPWVFVFLAGFPRLSRECGLGRARATISFIIFWYEKYEIGELEEIWGFIKTAQRNGCEVCFV